MKSLGMSFKEVGAIYGVSSIAAILSPFIIGLIADKLGNFKVTHISISFTSICLF
jgi:MFS family permease